jgi:hypothetical protein
MTSISMSTLLLPKRQDVATREDPEMYRARTISLCRRLVIEVEAHKQSGRYSIGLKVGV